MTFADVLSSAATIFVDPALLGAMIAGMSMGMVFGAAPGLGAKMGILLLMPMLFSREPAAGARSKASSPRRPPTTRRKAAHSCPRWHSGYRARRPWH